MVALSTFAPPSHVAPGSARILYWPIATDEDAAWAAALAPFGARVVTDREALDAALAEGADVIVSGWRAELAQLAAKLTQPLVVVGADLPEALVDAVAAGAPIRHVARPLVLGEELRRLVRTPRAAGPRHAVPELAVTLGGDRVAAVADLSNDGISFIIEDEELSSLLPGCELGPLVVRQDERIVLDGVTASVRHVEPLDPPGRYRVGCALRVIPTPSPPPSMLRDPALCAALIKTGLKNGLQLAPLDTGAHPGPELQLSGGRVDVAAGAILAEGLAAADADVLALGLVRGRFEVAGRLYRFTSVLTSHAPLTLALPATLEESQQRAAVRHRPSAAEPMLAELRTALGGPPVTKAVIDLSTSGLSFAIDPARELMPLGLRLGLTLRCGDLTLQAAATVRTFVRERDRLRCGVELGPLDEKTHARLSDHLMRGRFPDIEDGGGTPFPQLADFFRATGFLYPAKEAVLAPIMDQVQHTFGQLYGQPSRLFKSVVARRGDELVGHVSSVRVYQRTWMSQHLAATSSRHVSHLLNLGAAEYFGQSPDLEYFKIFFQRDIKWPARVFGGFARTLRDSKQSDLRELRHIQLATDAPLPFAVPAGLEVMEASDDNDLALAERHFVRREPALILRSDDLLRRELTLGPLNKQYARLGLYRRRRVLLALRRGVCVGFALAEVSSPGLNLSEALSLFRLHVVDEGEPIADQVRLALLGALHGLYRQAGRAFAGGLIRADEADAYARLGIQPDDTWLQWTCHRALYPRFCDYVDRLFEVLRRRRARE